MYFVHCVLSRSGVLSCLCNHQAILYYLLLFYRSRSSPAPAHSIYHSVHVVKGIQISPIKIISYRIATRTDAYTRVTAHSYVSREQARVYKQESFTVATIQNGTTILILVWTPGIAKFYVEVFDDDSWPDAYKRYSYSVWTSICS